MPFVERRGWVDIARCVDGTHPDDMCSGVEVREVPFSSWAIRKGASVDLAFKACDIC